jgi:hypothetical protein
LREKRFAFLKTAALRVKDRSAVEQFLASHPHTKGSCEFLALKSANGNASWRDWTVKTPATTEAAGLEERVCASCGEKEEREIAKLQPEEDEGDTDSGNTDSGNTDSGDSSNSSGDSSNTATEEENGAVGVIVTVVMIVVAVVIVVIVSLIAGGNKKSKPSKKFQTSKKGKKK